MARQRTAEPEASACCGSAISTGLTDDDAAPLAAGFAALADPVRLRLLSIIASQPHSGVCVCDLVALVGRSQPTVSHHLRVLREAGLIEGERRGTWVWYRVVPAQLAALGAVLR